RAQSAERM
ncbi:putative transcriptional regulator domain protein, partial [Vibrio parahaemolyticus V-223/04]